MTADQTTDRYPVSEIMDINDSILAFVAYSSTSGQVIDKATRYLVRKNDLSIHSTQQVFDLNDPKYYRDSSVAVPFFREVFMNDEMYNDDYIIQYYNDTNRTSFYNVYAKSGNYSTGSLVRAINFSTYPAWVDAPFIYDSTLYNYSYNLTFDTIAISSIDLRNGQRNVSRFFRDFNGLFSTRFPNYFQYIGPTAIHPQNDSLLLFQRIRDPQLQFINRFSLDTSGNIGLTQADKLVLLNNRGWSTLYGAQYKYFGTHFRAGGSLTHFLSLSTSGTDFDYYYLDMDYNGNILSTSEFGSDTVYGRSYSFAYNGNEHFAVGSEPYYLLSPYGAEKRKILIYREDQNVVDSLYLFGHRNHRTLSCHSEPNGDLFVMSTFSNAWTNDSAYFHLTKIPAGLITGVKNIDQEISKIHLYPNPTQEFLYSEEFRRDMQFKVYNISGQEIVNSTIKNEGEINLQHIEEGNYILVLFGEETTNSRKSAYFIKR